MEMEIIVSLIGVLSTTLSAFLGWFFGRRKTNAEASLLEVDGLKSVRDFYEKALADMNIKVDSYIQVETENRMEIRELRKLVDKLINDACLKKGCNMRVYYDDDTVNKIKKNI